MDERARGELLPQVTVTVPTQDEMREICRRAYGEGAMHDTNPQAFRLLRCGGKEVLFKVGYDQGSTLVVNKPGEEGRISGETTALYQEVKRLIEEHVRTSGIRMYVYELKTSNTAMLAWARGKGNDVFAWDIEIPPGSGSPALTSFLKYFYST